MANSWVYDDTLEAFAQTVLIKGLTETANPIILLSSVDEQANKEELDAYLCIKEANINEGSITFVADEKPAISITLIVKNIVASDSTTIDDITALVDKINELESEIDTVNNLGIEKEDGQSLLLCSDSGIVAYNNDKTAFSNISAKNYYTEETSLNALNTSAKRFLGQNDIILGIPDSNLDTLFTPGIYKALKGMVVGYPEDIFGEWIFVIVFNYGDNYASQLAIGMNSHQMAQRFCRQGTWSNWMAFVSYEDYDVQRFLKQEYTNAGAGFGYDLLWIDSTSRYSNCHKAGYYWIGSVDEMNNTWSGLNDEMKNVVNTSGGFMGYREVFWRNGNHILVRLTEMYPEPGRTWTNFYNYGKWSGWRTLRNS